MGEIHGLSASAADEERVGFVPLWFSVLGGIAAWTVHLLVTAALVPLACRVPPALLLLHLATLLTAGVAVWAGVVAWRIRRRAAATEPAGVLFLAVTGLLLNGINLMLILFEGTPTFFLDPCR